MGCTPSARAVLILCLSLIPLLALLQLPSTPREQLTNQSFFTRSSRGGAPITSMTHVCNGCGATFMGETSVLSHQRSGSACSGCGVHTVKVARRYTLARAVSRTTSHAEAASYMCNFCKRRGFSGDGLDMHQRAGRCRRAGGVLLQAGHPSGEGWFLSMSLLLCNFLSISLLPCNPAFSPATHVPEGVRSNLHLPVQAQLHFRSCHSLVLGCFLCGSTAKRVLQYPLPLCTRVTPMGAWT
jgi:hypothetical protein